MRFAGTAVSNFAKTPGVESYLDPMRPNAGEQAMVGDNIRAKESTAGTELMGRTAAKGITAAGEVEAAGILSEAQAAVANAQGNAAIMEGLGGIGSSLIGAIPTGGGGGGGAFNIGKTAGNFSTPSSNVYSQFGTGYDFSYGR